MTSLDGRRALAANPISMTFGEDGRVSGSASCNRFGADYSLAGEGLTIGKAFSSMMACEPHVMKQEQSFLDLLARTARLSIARNHSLLLHTGDGHSIRAKRA